MVARMLLAQITDDDGVLVLASGTSLRSRFVARGFDYDYPKELLDGAGAEELCAWQTNEEGLVTIRVHTGDVPSSSAQFVGIVRMSRNDTLLVLPYSQYTFACSSRRGEPENIGTLCARLKVDAGRYSCWVCPMSIEDSLAFDVFLLEAKLSERPPGEIPTIDGNLRA
jgi:hypothetical protein